jgi:hypothetical protein
MGEAVGRLFVGAGAIRKAEGRPLISFRRPDRAGNQHTEFAALSRVLQRGLETPSPSGDKEAAGMLC